MIVTIHIKGAKAKKWTNDADADVMLTCSLFILMFLCTQPANDCQRTHVNGTLHESAHQHESTHHYY